MTLNLSQTNQINWNHVYLFSEIATLGSIKAAAEKLELSSSTLSEHLSQLEDDLQVQLFRREHRRLKLTDQGAKLFHYAKQMFETGQRLIDVLSPLALGNYPISVGIVPGALHSLSFSIIADFQKSFGPISMRLTDSNHDDLEELMSEAKIDFGFTNIRTEKKNLVQEVIANSEFHFFVSKKTEALDLQDLLTKFPLLVLKSTKEESSSAEQFLDQLEMKPCAIISSSFPSFIGDLCQQGVGIAVFSQAHFSELYDLRQVETPAGFPKLTEKLFATWSAEAEKSDAVQKLKSRLDLRRKKL